MKITFEDKSPQEALEEIQTHLGGRKLAKIVTFEHSTEGLKVTIQKMGKSFLEFSETTTNSGVQWQLTKEKVALSHKAFKIEVLEKIKHVVTKAGGEMLH